jgi:hypothetical protein
MLLEGRASGDCQLYLVDLPPLLRRLLGEALVDHGHDLVEELAGTVSGTMGDRIGCILIEGCIGDLLQHCRRCPCCCQSPPMRVVHNHVPHGSLLVASRTLASISV